MNLHIYSYELNSFNNKDSYTYNYHLNTKTNIDITFLPDALFKTNLKIIKCGIC